MSKFTIGMVVQHKLGIQPRYSPKVQPVYIAAILEGFAQGFSVHEMESALDVEGSFCSKAGVSLLKGADADYDLYP